MKLLGRVDSRPAASCSPAACHRGARVWNIEKQINSNSLSSRQRQTRQPGICITKDCNICELPISQTHTHTAEKKFVRRWKVLEAAQAGPEEWLGSCAAQTRDGADITLLSQVGPKPLQNIIQDFRVIYDFSKNLIRICAKPEPGFMQNLIYDLCRIAAAIRAFCQTDLWPHNDPSAWRDYRDPIMATLTMTTYIPNIKSKLGPHCAGSLKIIKALIWLANSCTNRE